MDEPFIKPGQRKARSYRHASNNKYNNKYNENIKIYNETQDYFSSLNPDDLEQSILYDVNDLSIPDNAKTYDSCIIEVKNEDCLDMALRYLKTDIKLKILILNMASDFKPGGGVNSGKTAQEEVIFRRTNAFMTHYEEWYPLQINNIIYCPEIYIVRDNKYKFLDQKEQMIVSTIAVPALRKPQLVNNKYNESNKETMTQKIESIFKVAIKHKHDCLVLGALGCGVFLNPPEEVAEIFQTMIDKYGKYFKIIGFAVLVTKESDEQNIAIFQKIIKSQK